MCVSYDSIIFFILRFSDLTCTVVLSVAETIIVNDVLLTSFLYDQ